jgi:hypothetical protein
MRAKCMMTCWNEKALWGDSGANVGSSSRKITSDVKLLILSDSK